MEQRQAPVRVLVHLHRLPGKMPELRPPRELKRHPLVADAAVRIYQDRAPGSWGAESENRPLRSKLSQSVALTAA